MKDELMISKSIFVGYFTEIKWYFINRRIEDIKWQVLLYYRFHKNTLLTYIITYDHTNMSIGRFRMKKLFWQGHDTVGIIFCITTSCKTFKRTKHTLWRNCSNNRNKKYGHFYAWTRKNEIFRSGGQRNFKNNISTSPV